MQKGKNLLKLFLFFPILLFSQDFFILPDEAEHFQNSLSKELKKADTSIEIFSPFLDDYITSKTLKQMAKKGVKINIITQEKESKFSHLALFENISIYILNTKVQLKGTLFCIDSNDLFLLSNALEYKSLRKDYAFALHTKEPCHKTFQTLKNRSTKKE
jgi:hypothetical protein